MSYGFTFDGIHCSTFGVGMKSKKRPFLPATVDRLETIPSRPGAYDFGAELGPRYFELECGVLESSIPALRDKLRLIAQWLNPLKGAKPLVFDDEPDKTYYARYSGQIGLDQLARSARFTIPFICADPFAYGVEVFTNKDMAVGNSTMLITNDGTYAAPIEITIVGRSNTVNPTVILGTKNIKYMGTIPQDESVVIDTGKMTASKAGENVLNLISGTFLTLAPGENIISYADEGVNSALVTVKHKGRWL